MGNGLIFPYFYDCAMEGRRKIGYPAVGCRCKCVGAGYRQIRIPGLRHESVSVSSEVVESMLPRKSPKFRS